MKTDEFALIDVHHMLVFDEHDIVDPLTYWRACRLPQEISGSPCVRRLRWRRYCTSLDYRNDSDTERLRTTGKAALLRWLRGGGLASKTQDRFTQNESLIIENTQVTVVDIGEFVLLTQAIWREYLRCN